MAFADLVGIDGTQTCWIVELDLEYVTSATSAEESDGEFCYNTPATSQDFAPLTTGIKTRTFTDNNCLSMGGLPRHYNCVQSVSYTDDELEVGATNLGSSGGVTVRIKDFEDKDRDEDPFWDSRDPKPEDASYWRRLIARQVYFTNRVMRVSWGYRTDTYDASNFKTREYRIKSVTGPDANGNLTITGLSPLSLVEIEDKTVPTETRGQLATAIDATTLTVEIDDYEDEYSASPVAIRIDDEIMKVTSRSGTTFTLTERGSYGTTAAAHDAGQTVQECVVYEEEYVDEILADLMTTYGGIDSSYIPTADWQSEREKWLQSYRLTKVLSEPEKVTERVTQLMAQCAAFVWYEPLDAEFKLKAIRVPGPDEVATVTDDDLVEPIIKSGPDMTRRISQQTVLFGLKTPVSDESRQASYDKRLWPTPNGEDDLEYGTKSRDLLFGTWLENDNESQALRTSVTTQRRRENGKIAYQIKVTAAKAEDLQIAGYFDLTTRDFGGRTGQDTGTIEMQVMGKKPVKEGHTYAIMCEPSTFDGRWAYHNPTGRPNYSAATASERDPGWYLSGTDGLMANGDPGYGLQ